MKQILMNVFFSLCLAVFFVYLDTIIAMFLWSVFCTTLGLPMLSFWQMLSLVLFANVSLVHGGCLLTMLTNVLKSKINHK